MPRPARRCSFGIRLSLVFVAWIACWLVSPLLAADEAAARWFKGNTHTHSLWSDGDEFPEMVADWYKSRGYDFLVLTDHNVLMEGERWRNAGMGEKPVPANVVEKCEKRFGADWMEFRGEGDKRQVRLKTFAEVSGKLGEPGKFLLVQGEEITQGRPTVHINAVHLAEVIQPRRADTTAETIAANLLAVEEQSQRLNRPILAHVNHPNWSHFSIAPEELAAATAARFFEVFNGVPGVNHLGDATHPSTEKLWDIANTIRLAKRKLPPLYAIAADDAHHFHDFSPKRANPGRGWIVVRSKALDAHALIDAMIRGDFYASTGVVLDDVAFDAGRRIISLKIHAEPGVKYAVEFIGTLEGVDPEGTPVDNDANARRPGRVDSPDVGKVLARIEGAAAEYRMTGRELYVRAVVRSDKPMENAPHGELQFQEAWCQPMGW